MPIKDVGDSPASFNQRRLIINDNIGFTGNSKTLKVKGYTSGIFNIRGKGDCGFYDGISYDTRVFEYDLSQLPRTDNCIYNLELRDRAFDAPVIGQLITREFNDPNIVPLVFASNNITRTGINWVQLNENIEEIKGILESREVTLYPKGSTGTVFISGCGTRVSYNFKGPFKFNIRTLYPIDKDCMFDILVNNVDYLKEGGSLFVAVYKDNGGFLARPIVYSGRGGRLCFEFKDPYVGYTIVNDRRTAGTSGCGLPSNSYIVEGVTSKGRIFYGKYADGEWEWIQ